MMIAIVMMMMNKLSTNLCLMQLNFFLHGYICEIRDIMQLCFSSSSLDLALKPLDIHLDDDSGGVQGVQQLL